MEPMLEKLKGKKMTRIIEIPNLQKLITFHTTKTVITLTDGRVQHFLEFRPGIVKSVANW